MAVINLEKVSLYTKKKTILNEVSLNIPQGKIVGLLGPNGAGKSTLFKILSGLAIPSSGKVNVFNRVPDVETLKSLAILPDRAKLPVWLNGAEWLHFARTLYPDWDEMTEAELVESMEINLDTDMLKLSRGEEARLQLLTCLARNASLVLLDEPFTGVDMISREQIISNIIEMANEDKTYIIATHDIREVENVFDMIILIDEGKIIAVEDVETLRERGKSVESFYREVFTK